MKINRNVLRAVFTASTLITFSILLSGCAAVAAWITDAQSMLPLLVSSATSILSLIALFSGGALSASEVGTLNSVTAQIQADLKTVQTLVTEYEANPGATTLAQVETAANVVISNFPALLAAAHVTDAATAEKISAAAQLIITQFESWVTLLPTLSAKAGEQVTITVPFSAAEFRQMFNSVLTAQTSNPAVNAVLPDVKKI